LKSVAGRLRNDSFFCLPDSFYPEAPFRAGACPFTARHGVGSHAPLRFVGLLRAALPDAF